MFPPVASVSRFAAAFGQSSRPFRGHRRRYTIGMNTDQPRRPAGTPAGGQGAPTAHNEPDVDLRSVTPKELESLFIDAVNGDLPPDFSEWDLADHDSWTVAHVAAQAGHLPPDFDRWELADRDGYTVAHTAARSGHLPPDFDRWDIADKRGWTVAHEAALHYRGHLPPDFDRWDLADRDGWTVAHVAAGTGKLPPDFDRWDMADRRGVTVANEAALRVAPPPDFDPREFFRRQLREQQRREKERSLRR
jgi:hypothetical protein